MTTKWNRTILDEARAVATKLGLNPRIDIEHRNNGHLRVTFDANGKRKFVNMSNSPNCPFAIRHISSDFKRALRELMNDAV